MKTKSLCIIVLSFAATHGFASSFESSEPFSSSTWSYTSDSLNATSAVSRELRDFILANQEALRGSIEVGVSVGASVAALKDAVETMNYPLLMRLAVKAEVAVAVAQEAKALTAKQVKELQVDNKSRVQLIYVKNFRDLLVERLGDLI